MGGSIREKDFKDLADRRARREKKQPYASELEDREFEKNHHENSPPRVKKRLPSLRRGAAN